MKKNSHTIRFNKRQLHILVDMIESSIRICGRHLIQRSEEDQIIFDQYALELQKILNKVLDAIASCD